MDNVDSFKALRQTTYHVTYTHCVILLRWENDFNRNEET